MARIAASRNPAAAARAAAQQKAVGYALNPRAIERDYKRFVKLVKAFKKAVRGEWGRDEVKEPGPKEYVKYTQNYLSRAMVDFDRGVITVETLDQKDPLQSLKSAIVTTLLTPNDPRAVDLFSAGTVRLGRTPFLLGEVMDHDGKNIRWSWRAERFADHLIAGNLQTRRIKAGGQAKTVRLVSFKMVRDHAHVRARKYARLVEKFSRRFEISRNLVWAVIKAESDFNPFAVSRAPAFGLMQIVPRAAGREVYRFLNKQDGTPSKEFLFVPANNIEYGTAYLSLLHYRYFKKIDIPVSREYCVIAGYNTGKSNVLKVFDRNPDQARRKINSLAPLELYQTLRARLPYKETRAYLGKVLAAKKEFVSF